MGGEKKTPIVESAVSFEDWFMPKDFMEVDHFWVINTYYDFSQKQGECRKVRMPTDSLLKLGRYEVLETFKKPDEAIEVHKKYVEKMKKGKLKEEVEV